METSGGRSYGPPKFPLLRPLLLVLILRMTTVGAWGQGGPDGATDWMAVLLGGFVVHRRMTAMEHRRLDALQGKLHSALELNVQALELAGAEPDSMHDADLHELVPRQPPRQSAGADVPPTGRIP